MTEPALHQRVANFDAALNSATLRGLRPVSPRTRTGSSLRRSKSSPRGAPAGMRVSTGRIITYRIAQFLRFRGDKV